jgi:Na+/H+-dicarboxylate symporter
MKIFDPSKLKRRYPMEVVVLFPLLAICIFANETTSWMDPEDHLVYAINNISFYIGNLCFVLLILSVILRLVGAFKSMSKK